MEAKDRKRRKSKRPVREQDEKILDQDLINFIGPIVHRNSPERVKGQAGVKAYLLVWHLYKKPIAEVSKSYSGMERIERVGDLYRLSEAEIVENARRNHTRAGGLSVAALNEYLVRHNLKPLYGPRPLQGHPKT
jgi:hypothetical protein